MEWFGQLPQNWEVMPLWTLLSPRINKNTDGQEQNLLSLSYGHIIRKDIETRTGLLPASFNGYNIIEAGDIVLRLTDLQNDMRSLRSGLAKEHGIITSAYLSLKPVKDCQDTRYFHYLLHSFDVIKGFYNMGEGIRQNLNYDELSSLKLPLPPLDEQSRIASYLDSHIAKIDDSITRYKALSDKLDEYRKAVITKAVSKGEYIPIKQLVNYNQETLSESTDKDMIFDYVDIGSVSYEYGIEKRERMVFGSSPSRARRIVHPGDVIVSTVRTYLKAIAQIPEHEVPIIVSTGFIVMSANAKVSKEFLGYALKNEEFIWEVEKNSFGISYPAINSGALVNIKIRIPSKPEQAEIVAYLDKKCSEIDSSKEKIVAVVKKLEEYKKSLIYNAVTGKIEC